MISYAPAPNPIDPVGGDSLEELRRRKMLAELLQGRRNRQPVITSPTQGIAHVLDSAMEGFQESRERRRAEAQRRQDSDLMGRYAAVLGGGNTPAPAAPAAPSPSPLPASGPTASAPGDRPNSLQALFAGMSPEHRDMVARTMVGEAAGEGEIGMRAVGAVIGNRMIGSGRDAPGVILARNQFEPWNNAEARARMEALTPQDRRYAQAMAQIDAIARGEPDPTHGATHFYAPRAQAALGRRPPSWDDGTGRDIGNHRFFSLGYGGTGPNNRHGIPQQAQADRVTGSDGMDEAPLIDGRNLPPDEPLPVPATPLDAAGPAEPPLIDGRSLPPDPPLPPQALARALMEAPAPEPRPNMEAPAAPVAPPQEMQAATVPPAPVMPPQAAPEPQGPPMPGMMAGGAPVPMARPDIAPPPQAAPAGPAPAGPPPQALARALQMPERDRLMLMRDEGSLAPGEAEALRSGVPNNQALAAVLQGQPIPRPAPVSAPMAAPQGGPAPMPGQAPAPVQASPDQRMAVLLNMVRSGGPETRQFALRELQNIQAQNTPLAQAQLQQAQAQAALAQRNAAQPAPNSPEALRALNSAREAEANRLGMQGEQRARYIATGEYQQGQAETLAAQNRAREAEADRMGLQGAQRQHFVINGKLPDSVGNVSAADKTAGRQALEQLPNTINTIRTLERAMELNPQAFTGYTAGIRAQVGTSGLPGVNALIDRRSAEASREFNQIMTGEAIQAMASTLAGATTDAEMRRFIEILGDPSTPPEIRGRTIQRMLDVAKMQEARLNDRVQILPESERRSFEAQRRQQDEARRAGSPPAATGGVQEGATATNPQTGQRIVFRNGRWEPAQ